MVNFPFTNKVGAGLLPAKQRQSADGASSHDQTNAMLAILSEENSFGEERPPKAEILYAVGLMRHIFVSETKPSAV